MNACIGEANSSEKYEVIFAAVPGSYLYFGNGGEVLWISVYLHRRAVRH